MASEHGEIPQPYHIPGYTGTCPDVQYRVGKSFGVATHVAMCDPKVTHSNKLALSRMFNSQPDEDFGASDAWRAAARSRLEQEVQLLKGTRRPRSLRDRMLVDCPKLPLPLVTIECQGYKHPLFKSC
ncbi:protein FAM166B [Macrosteles quadrilineatus]|uniref:protein FAM166B n=1 Tax=Macrosteles quadrilineatus TaxID=74068 RepID=UPI0023E14404|nr:protein FAM166B [Macrosteles quadrilineatus]